MHAHWTACGWLVVAALACPGQGHVHQPYWTTRQQEEDGSWSPVRVGGREDARLRVTALMLLAKLGEGTDVQPVAENLKGHELEHEPESLKRGIRWLRRQQDQHGRIGMRRDPDWLLDHAMATYVLSETLRLAAMPEVRPDVTTAVDVLRQQLGSTRPVPGVEVRLWAEMIVRSLQAGIADLKPGAEATDRRRSAEALAVVLKAMPAAAARSPRDLAAENLIAVLAGGKGIAPSEMPWLQEPLSEPLAAFYGLVALSRRAGKESIDASQRVWHIVRRKVVERGEDQEGWEPEGSFGKDNGSYGTTAVAVLICEVCNRFRYLEVMRN